MRDYLIFLAGCVLGCFLSLMVVVIGDQDSYLDNISGRMQDERVHSVEVLTNTQRIRIDNLYERTVALESTCEQLQFRINELQGITNRRRAYADGYRSVLKTVPETSPPHFPGENP